MKSLLSDIQHHIHHHEKPVIVIIGPTACGKTKLSLRIAHKHNGEIINADSRQIYEGMDIGTAKIFPEEMEGIPHHLLSFKKPNEIFTVAEYKEKAIAIIENNVQQKKLSLLVGGTGLYINAICLNYDIPEIAPDWKLRHQLEQEENIALYKKLEQLDPESAANIHINQKRYIVRALEIALKGGKKSIDAVKKEPLFDYFFIGIDIPREILYERINQRVEKMFEQGLLEEVTQLLNKGYDEQSHAMNGIGYKEVLQYIRGDISFEQAKELVKQHTRNYAKRQMTWFRKMEHVHWIGI